MPRARVPHSMVHYTLRVWTERMRDPAQTHRYQVYMLLYLLNLSGYVMKLPRHSIYPSTLDDAVELHLPDLVRICNSTSTRELVDAWQPSKELDVRLARLLKALSLSHLDRLADAGGDADLLNRLRGLKDRIDL